MRLRLSLFVSAVLVVLPQATQAACSHNGVSYGVGATICSGGWLQECTPAGYWKAIGQCLKDDEAGRMAPLQMSIAQNRPSKADLPQPKANAAPLRN